MDSDLDDPNNHVPPIAPGDDWDDLDEVSEKSRMGLPPRKAECRLPPKRESPTPLVNRHAPLLKLEQEGEYNPLKPRVSPAPGRLKVEETGEVEAPAPTAKTARKAPAKKPNNADVAKTTQTARKSRGKKSRPDAPKQVSAETVEGRSSLPPVQDVKRRNVKEIDPANESPPARPIRKISSAPAAAIAPANGDRSEAQPLAQKRHRFSRGERADWGDKARRGSLRWMILAGLCVVALVVLAVVLSQLPDGDERRRENQSSFSKIAPDNVEPRDESDVLKKLELLTNSQEQAKSIFAAYASAKSPADFIGFAYLAERNRELMESKWKPLGMEPSWVPGDDSIWTVLDRDGVSYAVLEGILSDFTKFSAFFRQEKGVLKIDWKATAGFGTAGFAEMKKGAGDGSEIRARVSVADFYTFAFPEGKYRCYRVMSPNGEVNLWGYVPVGGSLDEEFQDLFLPSQITGEAQVEVQVILRLGAGHGESLPDQWMIDSIVKASWLED